MARTIDVKPVNKLAINRKTVNKVAIDRKPVNKKVMTPDQVYMDTRTVAAGQSMGLLLALTFPTAGTYTNATRL